MSYDKTTVPENEQTTIKDDFVHIIDCLQKEKKIKLTTFPANTHSLAPTANNWPGPQPAHAQVRQSSRNRDTYSCTKFDDFKFSRFSDMIGALKIL